ncbi:MAG: sugar phosphate isomerase/epimerase family protein [Planctomycetia bacterium]|jgi:hexulose-6-phosphate isomerase
MKPTNASWNRRHFLAAGATSIAAASMLSVGTAEAKSEKAPKTEPVVAPPEGKRILLSCKLGMISSKQGGKKRSLAERLKLAGEAGFDGVDLDRAAEYTPEEARDAVAESRVFVHNAINHAHWKQRLTSSKEEERATARANIEHCIRVSHAAGGCGVLIVIGKGSDGPADVVEERCREEIKKLLPMAAAYGQPILFENVWNQMFYDHDAPAPPEQSAEKFVKFVDSFNSPWVGMYYDIGNHWKYGQPGDWIRQFGHRCVKLDVKGFSRKKSRFTDIGEGDLPWDQVRKALADINFSGWATAEVKGGGLERLTTVCNQMRKVFGLA